MLMFCGKFGSALGQPVLKVKITFSLGEVILSRENLRLISSFRTTYGLNRLSSRQTHSQAFIFIIIISIPVYKVFEVSALEIKVSLTLFWALGFNFVVSQSFPHLLRCLRAKYDNCRSEVKNLGKDNLL